MKAAVYEAFGEPLSIQTVPDPTPADDGVVVRVQASGLCRSDWHGWQGHDADIALPHVPGHELAGVVEAIGEGVKNWRPGDRVTVPFACGCGDCPQCADGFHNVCDNYFQPGFTHWGSFAEYVAIRYADVNLVRLPDDMDFVTAASLGCRFASSFRAVVDQGRVTAGQWVAVFGCGGVGLAAIMIARALGARVIGIDINARALQFARELGASQVLDAGAQGQGSDNIIAAIKELTEGGAHVALDALGNTATCRNSILSLRNRGRQVQIGVMAGADAEPPLPMGPVMFNELEIVGSHGMQAHCYDGMLRMIAAGSLAPQKLIEKTVTLEQSLAELEGMGEYRNAGVTIIDRF